MRRSLQIGVLIGGLALAAATAAAQPPPGKSAIGASPSAKAIEKMKPSADASRVLSWISETRDNLDLPFVVIDKAHAKVFAFSADGSFLGSAPALMGLGRGDVTPAGTGRRRLADIKPAERITPAGRFIASLGNDLGEADILWVDYENAISLHRVITGGRKDRRLQRLASPSPDDNRISYGCVNVPVKFFEGVILPLFNRTNGIVYVLPEVTPLNQVFKLPPTLPGHSTAS